VGRARSQAAVRAQHGQQRRHGTRLGRATLCTFRRNRVQQHGCVPARQSLTLYALSASPDRLGNTFKYRWARFPRGRSLREPGEEPEEDHDQDMDDEDLEDEEDEYERAWPERAHHSETSFGYPLDSGHHRICASVCMLPAAPSLMSLLHRPVQLRDGAGQEHHARVWAGAAGRWRFVVMARDAERHRLLIDPDLICVSYWSPVPVRICAVNGVSALCCKWSQVQLQGYYSVGFRRLLRRTQAACRQLREHHSVPGSGHVVASPRCVHTHDCDV
jgi:hypothetical protein